MQVSSDPSLHSHSKRVFEVRRSLSPLKVGMLLVDGYIGRTPETSYKRNQR